MDSGERGYRNARARVYARRMGDMRTEQVMPGATPGAKGKPVDRMTVAELERGMTPRQVELARALAKDGVPKVEAYRRVYGYKGKSKNGLQVEATKAANHPKVSLLATVLRERESSAWWREKGKLQEYIMSGFLQTAEETESQAIRLKALELAGRTRFAGGLFEEPAANEANVALSGAMVDTLQAKLLCLLGVTAPTIGDEENQAPAIDTTFDPVPSSDTTLTDTPTGGGEGE